MEFIYTYGEEPVGCGMFWVDNHFTLVNKLVLYLKLTEIISFQGLQETSSSTIGVKTVGDLDKKPFVDAAKRVYTSRNYGKRAADEMAIKLCLRDPNWHPFVITTDKAGKTLVLIYLTNQKSQIYCHFLFSKLDDFINHFMLAACTGNC